MNVNKMKQEQISAFADGELHDQQLDLVLASLREPEGQQDWDSYHQIGDILRSKEMGITLSPNFMAGMAARLAAEPTIIAPHANVASSSQVIAPDLATARAPSKVIKRFALPGMIAAAVASAAFISVPQLMVATKTTPTAVITPVRVASAGSNVPLVSVVSAGVSQIATPPSGASQENIVLRDPRIDEYLLAHQRFSPSVYSTAQFARSATFATDSDK